MGQFVVKPKQQDKPKSTSVTKTVVKREKIPDDIKEQLHFLLYSELSKWKNKSDGKLLMVKQVAKYFDIDVNKKPEIKF